MGKLENNLKNTIERSLTKNQRLWRANSGYGWSGRVVSKKNGVLSLTRFRPFFGMPAGTPDMIGFDSVEITNEMVGKKIAVFVGSELKATKSDKLSKTQNNFKDMLVSMGGVHREHREDGSIIESTNIF